MFHDRQVVKCIGMQNIRPTRVPSAMECETFLNDVTIRGKKSNVCESKFMNGEQLRHRRVVVHTNHFLGH